MRHLAFAAWILGVGISAFAQPASPSGSTGSPSPANDPGDPENNLTYGDTVVVTASLEEEEASELASAVTVLRAEEIEARQATSVADMLRTVPGADVVRQGSPGKITSLFLRGTSSTQTLVLWNGLQLNDPSFGGFDWAFLSTDGVERIEVVRGPASALYGSEAIGGVVQVLTRDEGRGLSARLEAGGDEYHRGSVSGATQLGAAHLYAAGSVRRGDGEIDNDFFHGEEVSARLGWSPTRSLEIQPVARWDDSEVGLPFGFFGQPTPEQTSVRTSSEVLVPAAWNGRRWEVEGQLGRHGSDLLTRNPDAGERSQTKIERVSARLVATRHFGDQARGGRGDSLWLAGGADWEDEEVTSSSPFGPGLRGDSQLTWAGFAQLHGAAGPVAFELGARRDDADSFGAETSLRGGLVWRAATGLRLRAAYGEGFRAPSLGELFFPGFGNPDLGPETSESMELGLELDRGRWHLRLAAFDLDLEGLIVSGPPAFVPENVGRADSTGVEALLRWLRGPWSVQWSATRLDTENRATGEPLPRRPDWRSSLVLGWRSTDAWTVNAVTRWVGERTDVGGVELEDYTVFDLALARRVGRWIEPYARVENLFDQEYQEAAGFPAPDRRVVGGLAVSFR